MLLPVDSQYADFWLEMAVREIRSTYGHEVDVKNKAKTLVKFGRTRNADSSVKTTVAVFQGDEINETFVSDNLITSAVSDDTGDTEQTLVLEGHTIDTGGDLTFTVQDVGPMTGQTPVSLATPLARATRAYVKNGTFSNPAVDLSGRVYFYTDTGVTAGVPKTASATKLVIEGDSGINQTEKAATSVSATDYWILTGITCALSRGGPTTVTGDFDIEVRQLGGVWRPLGLEVSLRTAAESNFSEVFRPYKIVPPNSDVRLVVRTNTDNSTASGRIRGILAKVLS